MSQVRRVRFLLIGAGNVGRRFLELVLRKGEVLQGRLGLDLILVGVADTSGVAVKPEGLDPEAILALKARGRGVAEYPAGGRPGAPPATNS